MKYYEKRIDRALGAGGKVGWEFNIHFWLDIRHRRTDKENAQIQLNYPIVCNWLWKY